MNNAATINMSKKVKIPLFFATTLGTLLIGMLTGLLSGSGDGYKGLIMPTLSPPDIVFPIVWSILYLMIGLSLFFIIITPVTTPETESAKKTAIWLWIAQIVFNYCWSFAFFTFELYIFSFVWLCLLLAINMALIITCFKFSRPAAWLLIPYEIWLIFAAYLNLFIAIYN